MKWLERHINGFCKFTGSFFILIVIFGTWAILQISGIPSNSPITWTSYQWHMFNFLWVPSITYSLIYLLFAILCFNKKYFIFPIIILFYLSLNLQDAIGNIIEIIHYGFIYPVTNLLGIFGIAAFILSIIGTIFWTHKLIK